MVVNEAIKSAIMNGNIELLETLLVNESQDTLSECLCNAAAKGLKDIVKVILGHAEFDVNRYMVTNDEEELTAIDFAATGGHADTVGLLMDHGAGAEQIAVVLFQAVCKKQTQIVKVILERGYDPNHCTSNSHSLSAFLITAYNGYKEIATLLLDHGANINGSEINPTSSLCMAASRGHKDIVTLLLDRGADINKEHRGKTALTYALQKGNIQISEILIRQMILMKLEDLNISDVNLNAAKANEKLFAYQEDCSAEIESLKSTKFDGSSLSYFDVYRIKDVGKLTALASNENIVKVLKSGEFKNKFPIYGDMVVENFDRGILGNKDFELFKRFCNYLSTRKSDQLPKLPFTSVCKIFIYLSAEDVDKLRNV